MRTSLLAVLILAMACPRGGSRTPDELTIEDLRARAAERPDDAAAQRAWAAGELLRDDGDPARAADAIAAALRVSPNDGSLHLLKGLDAYSHGEPTTALDAFLTTLENSDGTVAEVAAAGVEELTHIAPNFRESEGRLAAVRGRVGPAAAQTVTDILLEIAYQKGDMDAVRRLASETGCLREWRVAGPFGPRDLLGFDQNHEAFEVGPLADEYDLGVLRGTHPTRTLEARGCAVHLGAGPVPAAGTTYAEAFFEAPEAGRYTLRLETPNSVELRVDGQPVARLDHRRQPLRRVTFHTVELTAGRHEIAAKVTTRHPNPILGVTLSKGTPNTDVTDPALWASDDYWRDEDDVFTEYLRASALFSRGNTVGAREAFASRARGPGSPVVRTLQSAIALADPLVTSDMRRDNARRLLRGILERDDRAWFPVLQLARLKAADGRDQEAIADLRRAIERWPGMSTIRLTLVELLLSRGWDAEANTHIARSIETAPGSCPALNAALASARRRDRITDIDRYTDAVMECDARNSARFQLFVRQRRWDNATAELDRLASLEPRQSRRTLLGSRLDLAEGRADNEAITALLNEMQTLSPRSDTVRLAQADLALAQGDRNAAVRVLGEAIASESASMADLRRIHNALGGPFELEGYRMDGAEVLREFEAAGREYDQPQVLVFDYTVVRVFEDMSSVALTHQIYKLQSEEAVDAQGEFSPPSGATLLNLHTIKPDGVRLEPDLIEGKETISLPNLAVGDYVEQEYLRVLDPPSGIPGGLLGDRFYFASFELPFDRSELVVVLPEGMDAVVDPRGPAPETQRSQQGDQTVLRWRVDQSQPLVEEPASISIREFIPSINWGVRATWSGFLGGLRDVLADREVADPAALRLAHEVAGTATSDEEKARRIYSWLLENVENNNEVFGQAAVMLAGRTGNRARILHYLLGLLDVRSTLVLARGANADQTQSNLADEETYSNLVVQLGASENATYLHPSSRGVPFGYVSPALRGQDALVLTADDPASVERVTIPPATGEEDFRRIEVTADIAADGSATVDVVETVRGYEAIQWRADLEGIPEAMIEQRFEEAYVARLLSGGSLESLRIAGREDPEQPFVLRYTARVPALARQQGNAVVLPAVFPTMMTPRFARVGERRTTQIIGPPVNLDVVVRIKTIDGAPRVSLPPVSAEASGASFSMESNVDGDYLTIQRRLRVPLGRVQAGDYERWALFCRTVDEAEGREIRLR